MFRSSLVAMLNCLHRIQRCMGVLTYYFQLQQCDCSSEPDKVNALEKQWEAHLLHVCEMYSLYAVVNT